ncbi:Uncharacterised protein [Canicola haemoglobinophilus]|uniref:Uncharacterized protein n=1 Tax=Canicola haemoglobinophilus TaxID=733 RepID=A0AB38HBQ7_9PAST|nr:hypothetical protein [Canicola haemoglobinophilus]STO55041.1 Uncharacterised protein [Canicola haemoglobinophilus]STO69388.1 Uncharacterised protein [Canicola haemoglobinophilus]
MSELFDEHNPKICLEVIFKNSHEIYDVVIDANTKVLGGKLSLSHNLCKYLFLEIIHLDTGILL